MPYEPFRELLTLTGLPAPAPDAISITGSDPVLQTPYKVGTAGAAAEAAIGVAISEVWKQQTGRGQDVAVDVRAAAFNVRGQKHTFIDGKPVSQLRGRDPWFRFYPVKDGRWIRVHTSFAHHRDRLREVLGNPDDVEAGEKVTATWNGVELEDAIHAAGGCAALVRTPEEWAQHPQSLAIGALPLLEIERLGDSPREPLPSKVRPLGGVRVLDLTRVIAGPVCGRTLAEHGADVLKINGAHLPDSGVGELDTGLGKLSALLDLRSPEGLGTLKGLLREADVFSQGYRPGSLAARGLAPEDVAKLRPGIVYVELSAWGKVGPWKNRRGYDTMVQAASGMSMVQGKREKPVPLPVSVLDYVTGYLMALGAIVALHRRATEGGSWVVRASLARTQRWLADLGTFGYDEIANVPSEPPASEIDPLSDEIDSPSGRIRFLRPVVQLSETPAYWARPPVPLGYNDPVWPQRDVVSAT